jgi:hypothetical protein
MPIRIKVARMDERLRRQAMNKTAQKLESLWTEWLSEARTHLTDLFEKNAAMTLGRSEGLEKVDAAIEAGQQKLRLLDTQSTECVHSLAREFDCEQTVQAAAQHLSKEQRITLLAKANQVIVVGRQVRATSLKNQVMATAAQEETSHVAIVPNREQTPSRSTPAA